MNQINLYDGALSYWRGKWSKDSNEKDFIKKDDNNLEHYTYQFSDIPAKSVEQLVYIISKRIQEELELDFPVFIDWREVAAEVKGQIPETSERFEKLSERLQTADISY